MSVTLFDLPYFLGSETYIKDICIPILNQVLKSGRLSRLKNKLIPILSQIYWIKAIFRHTIIVLGIP